MADGIINGERATSCVALSAHLGCCMPSCVPTEAEGVGRTHDIPRKGLIPKVVFLSGRPKAKFVRMVLGLPNF